MGKLFERTEEMREGFATLQVNADAMSVSMVTANEGMKEFSLVSDDFNANVEAVSNLLAAGFTDSNMAEIFEIIENDICIGHAQPIDNPIIRCDADAPGYLIMAIGQKLDL